MTQLDGWEGPIITGANVCRYFKTISWIMLHIDIEESEFRGGVRGTTKDFEISREDGVWKRFDTDLAYTPDGHLCLRLKEFKALDVITERTGECEPVIVEINTVEDLAAYLEECAVQ